MSDFVLYLQHYLMNIHRTGLMGIIYIFYFKTEMTIVCEVCKCFVLSVFLLCPNLKKLRRHIGLILSICPLRFLADMIS